jgi:hypothetical protein
MIGSQEITRRRLCRCTAASTLLATFAANTAAQAQAGAISIASIDSDPASVRTVNAMAAALRPNLPGIQSVVGQGPVQNVTALLNQDIAAALVPADVVPYLAQTRRVPDLEQRLQYITLFEHDEVHILAQAEIKEIAGLAGRPVNFGPADSRSNITASMIFDNLAVRVQPTSFDPTVALHALQDRQIAALVHVARTPAPLFFSVNFDDRLHFLPVPQTPRLLKTYLPSRLRSADYPLLIGQGERRRGQPVGTISVPVVIAVSARSAGTQRYHTLALLTDTLFPFAQGPQPGAPDALWAQFDPASDVSGWQRFPPAAARLQGQTAVSSIEQSASSVRRRVDPHTGQSQQDRQKLFEEYLRWRDAQDRR